jgi:hypothetical protein
MAGQGKWDPAGSSTNAYIVNPRLEKDIYWKSTYNTIFGSVNGNRSIKEVNLEFTGGKNMKVNQGNDSPVWAKDMDRGNETRFTQVEFTTGMGTYGEADVRPGNFDSFLHDACYTRQIDSPEYPVVGDESQMLVKEVLDDVVELKRQGIEDWRAREVDLDAFRSIFMGASRGLLLTSDGGYGLALPGSTAGQQRSCWNTAYCDSNGYISLTSPAVAQATHEAAVNTAIGSYSDDDKYQFSHEAHRQYCHMIEDKSFKPVTVGGRQYKALALIDRRLIDRLAADMQDLFKYAYERGKENPAVSHLGAFSIDDILYMPARQMEFFRPTAGSSAVTYGAGISEDPREDSFTNSSNICGVVYLGAGALLRAESRKVWFSKEEGRHKKGLWLCSHYDDGWKRREWVSKDGRTKMDNDSSIVGWHYDPGFQRTFAA